MTTVKRFKDYTNEELLSLTDEQIEELIRLECAFEGIAPTMEEPIWKEENEVIIPKVRAYTICDITVLSSERAEAILDVLTKGELFYKTCANNDYDCKYLEIIDSHHYRNPTISISDVILPEVWKEVKEEQKVLSQKKELFKKQKKEYESMIEKRLEISEPILEAIQEIKNDVLEKQRCCKIFQEYLILAKGDFEIALSFYKKANISLQGEDFIEHLKRIFQPKKETENNG